MVLNKFFTLIIFIFYFEQETFCDTLVLANSFGNFHEAASITSSREQFIFVSDIAVNMIYKFDINGILLASFGGSGFGNNEFNLPICVDASNGLDVFVCDYMNNRIQRYDLKLNFISTIDFNLYNLTADISNKIYYPLSFTTLPSSEMFVICDAISYRIAKIKKLDEPLLLFGNSNAGIDKLLEPVKIVSGSKLDLWILDRSADEAVNFDNSGTYIKRVSNPGDKVAISISFYGDQLYFANNTNIYTYNTNTFKFDRKYTYNLSDYNIIDINILSKENILLLTKKKVYNFKIINQ